MLSRSGVIACSILLAAGIAVFAQQSDLPSTLEQVQDTLKRLQAEVKSLRATIKQLKHAARDAQTAKVSKLSLPPAPPPATGPPDLEKAGDACIEGRRLEDQKLYRAAVESYSRAIQFDPRRDAALSPPRVLLLRSVGERGCYFGLRSVIAAAAE